MRRLGIVVLALLAWNAAPARAATQFTDFTSVTTTSASGTLQGVGGVAIVGDEISTVPGSVIDGTSTAFSSNLFTPPLPTTDAIEIRGATGRNFTIGSPSGVVNPVIHINSLLSQLTFPAGTTIQRLSGDGNFVVSGNVVRGTAGQADANGTVRLVGTFNFVQFSTTPQFAGSQPDGILVQLGADPFEQPRIARLRWPLDEDISSGSVSDATGQGNTGTISGAQPIYDGRFGRAFRVPVGASIASARNAGLETPRMTAVMWLRRDGAPASPSTLIRYGTAAGCAGGSSWSLTTTANGGFRFQAKTAGGTLTDTFNPVPGLWDGGWHALAISYDGASPKLAYGNTVSGVFNQNLGSLTYSGTRGLEVGGADCPEPAAGIDVDDVRLYPSALSDFDLRYLTNRLHVFPPTLPSSPLDDSPLIARYPLNAAPFGSVDVTDASGHGLHGRNSTGVATDGRFAQALSGEFEVPNPTVGTRILEPFQVTLSTWIRGSQPYPAARTIIGKGGTTCNNTAAYGLLTKSLGQPYFRVETVDTNGVEQTVDSPELSSGAVFDGTWHALAGTFDGNQAKIYLDGALVGTTTMPPGFATIDYDDWTDGTLGVGWTRGCAGSGFGKNLDEVQIYDRAITAQEIAYLHDPSATQPPVLPMPTPTATPTPTASATATATATARPRPRPRPRPRRRRPLRRLRLRCSAQATRRRPRRRPRRRRRRCRPPRPRRSRRSRRRPPSPSPAWRSSGTSTAASASGPRTTRARSSTLQATACTAPSVRAASSARAASAMRSRCRVRPRQPGSAST